MKTVILDASGVFHAVIRGNTFKAHEYKKTPDGLTLEYSLFRTAYLGHLLMYANQKVGRERFTENVVVALDAPPYWRKEVFPGYKCTRSASREKDEYNWGDLYQSFDRCVQEFKENVPWKFLKVESLEADDIIGILTPRLANGDNKVNIISSDHDLVQLQRYKGVTQFSPITKKAVKPETTAFHDLMIKIVKGDTGDAIPNIYSPDNFFLEKVAGVDVGKQKPISAKFLAELKDRGYDIREMVDETALKGFKRNLQLVDLSRIPSKLVDSCIQQYNDYQRPTMTQLQTYLVKEKVGYLSDRIKEFFP